MSDYLITYDINLGHKDFLTEAEKKGLLYVWKGSTYVSRLPNTTLWGEFASKDAADEAFDLALKAAGTVIGRTITLEKRVTVKASDWYVQSDKRKKPEPKWTGETAFETSRLHQRNDPFFK